MMMNIVRFLLVILVMFDVGVQSNVISANRVLGNEQQRNSTRHVRQITPLSTFSLPPLSQETLFTRKLTQNYPDNSTSTAIPTVTTTKETTTTTSTTSTSTSTSTTSSPSTAATLSSGGGRNVSTRGRTTAGRRTTTRGGKGSSSGGSEHGKSSSPGAGASDQDYGGSAAYSDPVKQQGGVETAGESSRLSLHFIVLAVSTIGAACSSLVIHLILTRRIFADPNYANPQRARKVRRVVKYANPDQPLSVMSLPSASQVSELRIPGIPSSSGASAVRGGFSHGRRGVKVGRVKYGGKRNAKRPSAVDRHRIRSRDIDEKPPNK